MLPEDAAIKRLAATVGLPVAAYLCNVALSYRFNRILDDSAVADLVRLNGDLGRLDNLLKLWLTNDPRTAHYGPPLIRAVLSKIEITMDEMQEIMQTVVIPKAKR
ncbi:MAG: conjugal transfer protein TraJ [Geobacteraceae bacterium]|nr:conjugal transfer protein TraJ [Geobacteraceae bacterium]